MEAEQLLDRQAVHVFGDLLKPDTRVKRHTSLSRLSLRPSQEPQQTPSQPRGLYGRAFIAASGLLPLMKNRRRTAWRPQPAASIPLPNSRTARVRARCASSCPLPMTIATGQSITSRAAIRPSPTYQATRWAAR